ncbi:MAG: toluene monooxygenase [Alphaproteobacteria bacterium]|nr:toluene monooxygenase [Pseudomonadota bacterium]
MALLERSEWYDLARQTNWTPKYVTEEELFPDEMADPYHLPQEDWDAYDEPYKVAYSEYVKTQREKDAGAYSVKTALERAGYYANANPGWQSIQTLFYTAVPFIEYASGSMFGRFTRFAKGGGMRNMASFGSLDEMRHCQIQLWFGYANLKHNKQLDWAHKGCHSNNWAVIGARHTFDDIEHTRDVVSSSIMTNLAFETAFTNLQFIAFAADAAKEGDYNFSNFLQSIQTDESRHAQIAFPLVKMMVKNGKKDEAQKLIDIAFWRTWRQFAVLMGMPMDYYMPLEKRERSFKEFMEEWVVAQFERQMNDLGLDRPWYWDIFLNDLEYFHHSQALGIWLWRPTVWWNPVACVGPKEREWLEKKYPGWNDTWGTLWDTVIENLVAGHPEMTIPETLPIMCNMSQLAITGVPGKPWTLKVFTLDHEGRRYNFGTEVDRWIFQQEPDRYKRHLSAIDRYVTGVVQPQTPEGMLDYMGVLNQGGQDAYDYSWVEPYRGSPQGAE